MRGSIAKMSEGKCNRERARGLPMAMHTQGPWSPYGQQPEACVHLAVYNIRFFFFFLSCRFVYPTGPRMRARFYGHPENNQEWPLHATSLDETMYTQKRVHTRSHGNIIIH